MCKQCQHRFDAVELPILVLEQMEMYAGAFREMMAEAVKFGWDRARAILEKAE